MISITRRTALLMLVLGATAASVQAQFDLSWYTIDGGGGTSTGGGFELSGTIGQPDAGSPDAPLAGGGFELVGGFWFPPLLASSDCTIDSWASIQHHGPAGPNQELGIPLVEGADTVDCRFAQTQHLIRVELSSAGSAPVVAGTVQAVDQNTAATFNAAANLTDNGGGSYTLDLVFNPPLPTALDAPNVLGCYKIDLAPHISCLIGDTDMRFKVVIGDVSEDGQTLLNDFALTKLRAQVVPFAVDPGNLADIRKDISNDGQIVLNDVALVKLNQFNGRILTCP